MAVVYSEQDPGSSPGGDACFYLKMVDNLIVQGIIINSNLLYSGASVTTKCAI